MTFDEIPSNPEFSVDLATAEDISEIRAVASRYVPLEATEETVRKVQIRSRSIFAVRRRGKLCGGFASLFLNDVGLAALLKWELSRADPSFDHLTSLPNPVAAIYVWTICLPGEAAGNVMEWLKHPACRKAPIFSQETTNDGRRFMERGGGVPLEGNPHLWIYHRV
ncbi:MAG: hypothetical protein ACREC9_13570 [Methylocella sp.]